MEKSAITPEKFKALLPFLCASDTAAANGEGWSVENPTWGHCAVASLVAQNLFGGDLMRISLEGTEFAESRSHYFNRFADGTLFDTTDTQFQGRLQTTSLPAEPRLRSYVLGGADTKSRYVRLAFRFARAMHADNPLFDSHIYQACLLMAYESLCQKAGFGAVVVLNGKVVCGDYNRPIDALCDMCEPECIRLKITSRTESMLGACGHAEEWAISAARERNIPLSKCDLYIAGIKSNGMPHIKDSATHTCLRCAVQMHFAKLHAVWVPVRDHWESLTTEKCLSTAKAYALGEREA